MPRIALLLALALGACGGSGTHGHPHAGTSHHRFERAEEWAERFDDPARDAWQKPDQVVALMAIEPGMVVADIGAGTGYFMKHLSKAVGDAGRVLALDIEPDMVRYMRERAVREEAANVTADVVPADDPRLPPGAVHRVLIVNTWHHIADRPAYARKLVAGMAPGGRVFVVDFTLETVNGPPRHERIPPDQVMKELEAGGFASARLLEESLSEQYVVEGSLAPN